MRRPILLALLVCLAVASAASADLPLPPDVKYITPRVRFENLDKYADHVFFLRYHSGAGNPFAAPPKIVEVKNAEPFEMTGGRRIAGVQLFAVPHDAAARLRKEDPTLAWVNDKSPGLLKANVVAPATTASVKEKEVPVTAYGVTIKEDKLTVEQLPGEKKKPDGPGRGQLPLAVFGTMTALSLAMFGIWFARRRGPATL